MAVAAIASLKNMLRRRPEPARPQLSRLTSQDETLDPLPSVGFRVAFQPATSQLQVTVIGARHLPSRLVAFVADKYLVKVKLFPGRERFETQEQPESWPSYGEEFTFHVEDARGGARRASSADNSAVLCASRFLVLTVYAVDGKRKRKTIGAATWPLDQKMFAPKRSSASDGKAAAVETADIWRRLQDIKSGVPTSQQTQHKREVRKNQLEVCMCYTPGDVGENDLLAVVVNRLRWSLDLTREYEEKKALLYVKLSALEVGGYCIKSRNSKTFAPSISVHMEQDEAQASLDVPLPPAGQRRDGFTMQLSLCTRPSKIGKKLVLGRARISRTSSSEEEQDPEQEVDQVTKALGAPGVKVTQWHTLL